MINKVILVGRLCADPEMKYTPSSVPVVNFRIAVDRPFNNAQGEREADFIDVVAWRQSAEFVNTYCTKGRLVLVDGRLQVRQWTTADQQRRRTVEVVADQVRALDRPREARDGDGGGRSAPAHREEPPPPSEPPHDFDGIIDPFADQ